MSTQRSESKNRRAVRGRVFLLERLEERRLLAAATEAFTGPSLSGLISQAFHGKNTAQAAIKTMLSALQTQLTNGPLAVLNSPTGNGNVFITEAQRLVASYDQNVDQQLLPHFTHIDNMLKLEGQQVVANLVSLNQQSTVGFISNLPTQAGAAINTLTGGPIHSLDTPVSAYVMATQTFETDLGAVAATLTATTPLTLPQVSTTIQAEAEAYRASMDAGLQVTHPNISSTVNAAVTTLESSVIAIANASPTPSNPTAESDIHAAIATFDSTILDTTGLFGLNGPVIQVNSELGYVPHNLTGKQTATTISVSGTATFGGPATLTATLKSATGTGLGGKVVSFTLDGASAGTAVTDSSGVATLTGVTQNDTVSTPGTIVASFAGDSTNLSSQNTGNLVVSQSSTTTSLTSSANPSVIGASVTFTATVAAVSPGTGTPTGTVTFMDGGTTIVGSPVTLTAGVATIATSPLTAGAHSITAVYSGDLNFTTSNAALTQTVGAPAITSATSTTFTAGTAGSFTVTATGAPTPTLSESSTDTLPSGVTFDATTGVLSGTPAATAGGTYTLHFTASNGVGSPATQTFTLTVDQAPAITSATSTTFTTGTAGTFTVVATGFPTPTLSEASTDPALPTGVTFDAATGVLSGTPAAGTGGVYTLHFTATNSVGTSPTQTFTLTVDQAPTFTSAATTTFAVNTAGSFPVTATGYPISTMTLTVSAGTPPAGVLFTDNGNGSATIAGTASTAGPYTFTITANNGVTPNATQPFTLTVNP